MNAYSLKFGVSLIAALSLLSSHAALAGPVKVTVGTSHSLVVKSDGSAWGWGDNDYGQLGSAQQKYFSPVLSPVKADVSNVVAVAAPCYTTHVLKADGTVWSYGDDEQFGVLGSHNRGTVLGAVPPITTTYIPQQVLAPGDVPLTNVIAISAFAFHSMALKSDGTVWAWGQGRYGELGDGTETDHSTAVQVLVAPGVPLTGVVAIATGAFSSYAIKSNGTVWAWGSNTSFALGTQTTPYSHVLASPNNLGSTIEYYSPWAVKVPGLRNIVAVAPGTRHYAALKNDGTVWTWGRNAEGQLGDGSLSTTARSTPVMLSSLSGVTKISTHWSHTLALKGDGTVWTWGPNDTGQLGNGTTTARTTPGMISTLTGVKEIAAGTNYSLAITLDGRVFAWGDNGYGQLGAGYASTTPILFPIQVQGITP